MAYRALYRKYRPLVFDDVVGQDAITSALSNQISANKIGHAYMFTGTRGTGKTTCAKLFARAVNCKTPNNTNPCGVCDVCIGLENGSILDVVEIDAASNNGVDSIRTLRDETAYRPSHCTYKVYIIDEVHMLSTAAFNALLKIMEEPPSHVMFILATTEIHKVPATVLSRCQRYDFLRISAEVIAKRLTFVAQQEGISLSPQAADLIARLADGAMRDALSLLDTCSGTSANIDEALVRKMAGVADKDYLFGISSAVAEGDLQKIISLIASLRDKSIDVKRLTEELIRHYRNFVLLSADGGGKLLEDLPRQDKEQYMENSAKISGRIALAAVKRLLQALDKMGRLSAPQIELELALFEICQGVPQFETPEKPKEPAQVKTQPVAKVEPNAQPVQAPIATETEKPMQTESATPQTVQQPAADNPPESTNGVIPFAAWDEVVQKMASRDRMLYNYMKNSQAFQEGTRVLIKGGDTFLSYMRQYSVAGENIKNAIAEVTGKNFSIGPYSEQGEGNAADMLPSETAQSMPAGREDTLTSLAKLEAMGLPVEYE